MALLLWSAPASAQYNPTDPPEPGFNYMLTTRCTPAGSASQLTSSGSHGVGSSVSMKTSAATGFHFVQWEDEEGNVVSTIANFTYTMPSHDVTLIARYYYDPSDPSEPGTPEITHYSKVFLSTYPYGGGSINTSSGQSYEVGSTQTFRASANTNYQFINWTIDGEEVGTSSTISYTVTEKDVTLVANFQFNPGSPAEPGEPHFPRTLSLKSNLSGAASLNGGGTFLDGSRQRVYVSNINQYYSFINWTDEEGNVVSEARDFYYTMPNRNVTLTANFTYEFNPDSPGEPGTPDPDTSIAENMVLYPRFGMYDDTHVMILCETEGSTIYYTTDGSDPTTESAVYTSPFFVGSNVLVKAFAVKEGMEDSPIRSFQVTVYKVSAPKFTFVNRKVEITSDTEGAIIRYTLDFSEPNAESEVYTTPLEPEENCRIKAYASLDGLADSPTTVFVYRRADYTIAAPTFSVNDAGQLVITPSVSGGTTHYTTDGSDPTADSPVYTVPITPDGNCVVKAYTSHINYFDSPIGEFTIDWLKVQRPVYTFTNPVISFSTETQGAQIRYTLDGSIPSEESTLYSGSLRLTEDCTVVARGFKENYEPSDTISFQYVYRNFMLPTPTASFANLRLTLSCSDEEAQIHYTIDGSEPTASSTLYEAPLALTDDCTVKFIATRENFNDSETGVFEFTKADYQVMTPEIVYNQDNHMVTISCGTEGAEIRYTVDGTTPTATTGTVYTEPFTVIGNRTITAMGFRSDLFDSHPAAVFPITGNRVATPQASFANRQLTLTPEEEGDQIRYTTDGSEPTASSTLYDSPLALTDDCTVKFIASREHFDDSEPGEYVFVKADHQRNKPTITPYFHDRKVTVSSRENATIVVTIDGETEEHDNSCDFDVNPTMKNISAIIIGDNNDICYDSEPESLDLVFHLTPEISYDGHEIIVSVNPNDPSKQNAERIITYNDETVTNETIPTDSFGSVTARVESDNAFRSEVASLEIDFFNTGTTAGARKGHRLAEAFNWNNEDDFTELTIVGDMNREDFDFLASLSKLTTLSLRPDSMAEESYANALNMPLLTTVEWGRDSEMPADIFGTSTNPNLLLWVDDESLAPATVRNVVTTDGTAESITLDAGFPFNPHMPVAAKHIEFRKKFNQPTEIDVCRGWETIILPFTPESIRHEEKGEIVPYERWNEEYDRGDYGDEGPKPFWIYEATPDDWIAARDIEAYVPYIISMPNNPEYIHAYNLAGQIIFAADDAILGDYDNNPGPWQAEWIDGLIFEGSFMPFEGEYRSLNNEWEEADGEILPGSYFLPDGVTLPFEACLRGGNPSQKLPLFPGGSGISLPTLDFQSGISVEAIGQGAIRLTSTRNCTADIYTTTGMRMRSVKLNAGESVTINDLAPGIYLVARHKIMIK